MTTNPSEVPTQPGWTGSGEPAAPGRAGQRQGDASPAGGAHEPPSEYRQIFEKLKGDVHISSRRGLKNWTIEEIEAFAHHYLTALGTLSRMRMDPRCRRFIQPCQRLLLDANILLYPEEDLTFEKLIDFFWVTLPAQLWRNRWFYVASTLIMAATTLIGFFIVLQNFEMAPVFMPSELRSSYELEAYLFNPDAQREMLNAGRNRSAAELSLFATLLMVNNIKVAVICYVAGAMFALPTLILLVQTGLMLGTLPALFYKGDLYGLGAWLLPHGVPEIGAILLAGGAGLKLGFAILEPGAEKTSVRFRRALLETGGTVIVCVAMLVWAGLVESFVRQSDLPNPVRYAIAASSVIPIALLFARAYFAHESMTKH